MSLAEYNAGFREALDSSRIPCGGGPALEAAFDVAFDALDKQHLGAVWYTRDEYLAVFNQTIQIGTATTPREAGELFTKAIKESR
jgi:hypothetical protein